VRIHLLLTVAGVNAVDYLFAFFGNWVGDATLVRMDFDNGRYRGMALTSLYWITGQYSRFVRPGDVRVAAAPATGNVLVSAYRGQRRATVVAINPGKDPQTIRARVTGARASALVTPVRSSASERWRALPSIPLRGKAFTATLPPYSITTFRLQR
jgi:O-glycosyl hydrolase